MPEENPTEPEVDVLKMSQEEFTAYKERFLEAERRKTRPIVPIEKDAFDMTPEEFKRAIQQANRNC